jgi:pimeloyl-ACP methyl ester carboxylesterase
VACSATDPAFREEAEQLATRFTVLNYDRRGRGESGDTTPYAREREVEDLAALIEAEGGSAMVYGRSSGAGLALNAAASGLRITRLVVFEPPYGRDDEDSRQAARELAEDVGAAIAETAELTQSRCSSRPPACLGRRLKRPRVSLRRSGSRFHEMFVESHTPSRVVANRAIARYRRPRRSYGST